MVHIVFDTSTARYDDYMQYGGGNPDSEELSVFKGSMPYQRGYGVQRGAGVGDVFRGLWRFSFPSCAVWEQQLELKH